MRFRAIPAAASSRKKWSILTFLENSRIFPPN
jgi:hypothetical protein